MDIADNDNRPPAARHVPLIGFIGEDGRVTITDARWRAQPRADDGDDGRGAGAGDGQPKP